MRTCKSCNKEIKNRTLINEKFVNTQRRKYCFKCSPFGSGNDVSKKVDCPINYLDTKRRKKNQSSIKSQKILRKERKKKLIDMFGGGCSVCGYKKCLRALEFHHIDKGLKKFNIASLGYTCSWERLVEEAKKCVIFCSNCHKEKEEELESPLGCDGSTQL